MKLKQWLYGAAALAMLAACSDKDVAPGGGNEEDYEQSVSGYIAVEIKLPQEVGATRTEENDQFNDGSANEYKVEDAMIILFKGTSGGDEKAATFYRAQELVKPFTTNDNPNDGITSSYIAAIPVTNTSNGNFWGMVILNGKKNNISITSDTDGNPTLTFQNIRTETTGEDGTVSVSSAKKVMTTANTFADFLSMQTTAPFYTNGTNSSYFFMTNSPLSENAGGPANDPTVSPKIRYLTDLGGATYSTPDEARSNVSGCIFVERAVSKVTCQNSFQNNGLTLNGTNVINFTFYNDKGEAIKTDIPTVSVQSVGYALTHTNQVSYVIRNVEFPTGSHFQWNLTTKGKYNVDYRMIGNQPMPGLKNPFHNEEKLLYRTYWCLDPNYGTGMDVNDKYVFNDQKEDGKAPDVFNNITTPLYCKENTFDVKNQNYGNTTLAIFKVNYNVTGSDDNLYTKDGDNSKIYVKKEDVLAEELNRIFVDQRILDALKASERDNAPNTNYSVKDHLNITYSYDNNVLLVKDIALKIPETGDDWFDANAGNTFNNALKAADKQDLIDFVNSMHDVTVYKDGISYYAIPIKHFGDYYTPWGKNADNTDITGITTEDVYNGGNSWATPSDDHAAKYLGRYGMVRNNWYDLAISKISSLGYASLNDIELTPGLSDDNNESKRYFAVEIHILSWAMRTQSTQF